MLVRLHGPEVEKLDEWVAGQPEPKPSRPEAIRRLVVKGIASDTSLQSDASLDRQIAEQKAAIAAIPEHPELGTEAALAKMDKPLAEGKLVELKKEKAQKKRSKK